MDANEPILRKALVCYALGQEAKLMQALVWGEGARFYKMGHSQDAIR